MSSLKIRKAEIGDAPAIFKVILSNTYNGQVMMVTLKAIIENMDEFLVGMMDKTIVACGALHFHYKNFFEICSISVLEEYKHKGIGSEITRLLIKKTSPDEFVFLATDKPEFYAQFNFSEIKRRRLPPRIWIHKIGNFLDQSIKNWPKILLKKFTFMRIFI